MLNVAVGEEGRVVTVYCNKVNIGGITHNDDDLWHWAVYCLRNNDPAAEAEFGPLGGVEKTQQAAFAALKGRWERWLLGAGLIYLDRRAA